MIKHVTGCEESQEKIKEAEKKEMSRNQVNKSGHKTGESQAY